METKKLIIEKQSPHDFDKTVELLSGKAIQGEWSIPAIHDLQAVIGQIRKDG